VRRDPAVQAYRVAAGIPPLAPPQLVVRQMLLVAMGVAPLPREVLVVAQQGASPAAAANVTRETLDAVLLPLVRSVDNGLSADAAPVAAFLGPISKEPRCATRSDCLADLIRAYACAGDGVAADAAFLKKHPQPDPAIIQAVVGLF